jgi:hypothetical protein
MLSAVMVMSAHNEEQLKATVRQVWQTRDTETAKSIRFWELRLDMPDLNMCRMISSGNVLIGLLRTS